jgi:hypothetical protein
METFCTVTMFNAEMDTLQAAAAAAGVSVEAYLLQAGLERAQVEADERKGKADCAPLIRSMIAAYLQAMGMNSADLAIDRGRTAKAAKAAVQAGRIAGELPKVVAWMRQVDRRFRDGQRIPLTIIVQQWPAYSLQKPSTQAPPVVVTAPVVAGAFGGETIWEE